MIFKFLFKSNDFSLTKEMSDLNILFFIFIFHISAKLPPLPQKKHHKVVETWHFIKP